MTNRAAPSLPVRVKTTRGLDDAVLDGDAASPAARAHGAASVRRTGPGLVAPRLHALLTQAVGDLLVLARDELDDLLVAELAAVGLIRDPASRVGHQRLRVAEHVLAVSTERQVRDALVAVHALRHLHALVRLALHKLGGVAAEDAVVRVTEHAVPVESGLLHGLLQISCRRRSSRFPPRSAVIRLVDYAQKTAKCQSPLTVFVASGARFEILVFSPHPTRRRGMDVRVKPGQSDKYCPYCRDNLVVGILHCNRCHTSYHYECVHQHGGCTTVGCQQGRDEPDWHHGLPPAVPTQSDVTMTLDGLPMPTDRELLEGYDHQEAILRHMTSGQRLKRWIVALSRFSLVLLEAFFIFAVLSSVPGFAYLYKALGATAYYVILITASIVVRIIIAALKFLRGSVDEPRRT